jgi:hypothetical protein
MNFGIDPKQSDQTVRGAVTLPGGTGKAVRVAVFAKDAKAQEAQAAGRRRRRRRRPCREGGKGRDQLRPRHRDART